MKKAKKFIVAALAVVSTLSFVVLGASCKGKDVLKTKFDQLICNHKYDEGVVEKEATCGEKGILLKTCEKCGKETKSDIKKTEHNPNHIEVIAAVEATCVKNGSSEGKKCMDCGEWVEAPKVEAAKAHILIDVEGYAATCTEEGLSDGKFCTTCEQMIIPQEVIAPLGHNMVTDRAVAATCTKTGLTEGNHCSRCETVGIAQEVVEKKAHTPDEDGKCTVCGKLDYEAFIAGGVETMYTTSSLGEGFVYRVSFSYASESGPAPMIVLEAQGNVSISGGGGPIVLEFDKLVDFTGDSPTYAIAETYTFSLSERVVNSNGSYSYDDFDHTINVSEYFDIYVSEDKTYFDFVVLKSSISFDFGQIDFSATETFTVDWSLLRVMKKDTTAATVSAEWVLPERKFGYGGEVA